VTGTPINDGGSGIAALASALSGGSIKMSSASSVMKHYIENSGLSPTILPNGTDGPQRTMYGGVWSTSSDGMKDGQSLADSAYGQGALPLHTDMTYMKDPPGLQVKSQVFL